MQITSKIKKREWIIYTVIWMIVLLMPIVFSQNSSGIVWSRVGHEWLKLVPFLFIFLFHNFILFPTFFAKKRHLAYIGGTVLFIAAISSITILIGREVGPRREFMPQPHEMPPDMPGMERRPFPGEDIPNMKFILYLKLLFEDFLASFMVVGFNLAIKLIFKRQQDEQRLKELEKQKLETELAFLKNQISPHFFMNTLNNIHALIDINSEDAKASLIKLSKLMRYLLYDSGDGKTTFTKEIEFIKSYVDLMRLRFTEQVKVKLSFPETIPDVQIPPMLFTSLLENAFKHGVSYRTESLIELVMKIDDKSLYFRIKNSKNQIDKVLDEPGGIGLDNLKKRLDLMYQNHYVLEQKEDEKTFEINIKLPLNG